MRIMLIDDEKDCLNRLVNILEPAGHHCEVFTLPNKALEAYASNAYDLVITDLKMPGLNGFQVLDAIQLVNSTARVIISTGYGDVQTAIEAVHHKAYAFLTKPVNNDTLFKALKKVETEISDEKNVQEGQVQKLNENSRLINAYKELRAFLYKGYGANI